MYFNTIQRILAAYAMTAATTVLAAPGMYQDIEHFTYNFGGWKDQAEKPLLAAEKGGCALILQAFDKVRFVVRSEC